MSAASFAQIGFVAALVAILLGCPGRRPPIDAADAAADSEDITSDLVAFDDADSGDAPTDSVPDVFVETAPRALAPLPSATVTRHTPMFQYRIPDSVTGVSIDICPDRDCHTVEQSFAVTNGAAQAPNSLSPGVHFWRLRDGSRTSPPWWFWVNVGSAVMDASWGSHPDLDGDGLPEILVTADAAGVHLQGRVYVYSGTRGSFSTTPSRVIDGAIDYGRFGWRAASAGDVNGDGYVDLIVGAPFVDAYDGRVYVFHGSSTGVASAPDTTLMPPDPGGNFGSVATGVGDVNGDGFADVIVTSPNTHNAAGSVYLYVGSPRGLASAPLTTFQGALGPGSSYGAAAAGAGDVNADGYADVIVGAGAAATGGGQAFLYLGRPDGLQESTAIRLEGSAGPGSQFGSFVSSAGDVNRDGYADLVVGAVGTANAGAVRAGSAYVFLGGANVRAMPHVALMAPDGQYGSFGWTVTGAGDIDSDGYDDMLVGAICAAWVVPDAGYAHCGNGRVYVYYGREGTQSLTPSLTIDGPGGEEGEFGWSLSGAGDVNGDGIADVVTSAYALSLSSGEVYVFPGSAGGLGSMPAVTLHGTVGVGEEFGWWVATRAGAVRPRG